MRCSVIVAQTGATITSVESAFYKKERHDKTLVDIGVLRFPESDNPHFKVYHIKLSACSQSERYAGLQFDSNGIFGEFSQCKFGLRNPSLLEYKLEKGPTEAEAIFK
ncbi:hypothetical protein MPER_02151 [Moniliophthora perniciosa FA553]|nr:hypothetical protein MPER_02151 [Moniliophthora perniciosa FA553]